MPDPNVPNRNNPFEKFSNSLIGFLKKVEGRDKRRDERLEKLIKRMIIYFQLLEKAFNKGDIVAKKGREVSLQEDKGFLKLVGLMVDISDNTKKIINKFMAGGRLVTPEKVELAKFTDGMKQALLESNEKIGIPIKELLINFKDIVTNREVEDSFRVDLVNCLKEYSEEDITLTDELKLLLEKISNTNKLMEGDLVSLSMELDKNIQNYTSDLKESTFAPFLKINNELDDVNISLEDIVDSLSESQRREQKKDEKGGFGQRLINNYGGYIAGLTGDVVSGVIRAGAISMSEPFDDFASHLESTSLFKDLPNFMNGFLKGIPVLESLPEVLSGIPNIFRQISPILAGMSGVLGGMTQFWIMSRFMGGGFKGIGGGALTGGGALVGKGVGLGKGALQTGKGALQAGRGALTGIAGKGVQLGKGALQAGRGALTGIAGGISAAGLASIYATMQLGSGFIEGIKTEGTLGEKLQAGAGKTTYGTMSHISKLTGVLTGGKFGGGEVDKERLSEFLHPVSESIGTFIAESKFEGEDSFDSLKNFIGEQNKNIFGANLNLSSILTNAVVNPLKDTWGNLKELLPEWLVNRDKDNKIIEDREINKLSKDIQINSIPSEEIELPPIPQLSGSDTTTKQGQVLPPVKIGESSQMSERKLKSDSDIINVVNINGFFT